MATEVASAGAGATLHDETLPPSRLGTFYSLQYRDYRYLWFGQVGASASQWMEQIARPLLIYALTESALLVGAIAASRMLPMLLIGVWAGVMADRMDKRKILLVTKSITLAMHGVTAALILTGVIEPWMVFVTAFIAGSAMAVDQPARQSLIPHVVPPEAIGNAVALNSAAVNIMRIMGPALAGVVLATLDFGALYLLQSIVYTTVIYSMLQIRTRTVDDDNKKQHASMWSDLGEGFESAWRDKAIFYILILSLAIFIWGMPFNSVFVPLIGVEELGLNESSVGILLATIGVGALLGSLIIATFGHNIRKRGIVMIVQLIIFALGLMALARADTIYMAIPALMVCGAMQVTFMSLNHAFVLARAPKELQGRIISLFSLDRGLIPMGALIAGALAEALGPQTGLMVMATICLSCTLLMALLFPALRKID